MATFSRTLEHTLRRALAFANEHQHEYVTLEHLLLALIDDDEASQVMHACKVDLDKLRGRAARNGAECLVLATEPDLDVVRPPVAFDPLLSKHRLQGAIGAPRYVHAVFGGGKLEGA